MKRNIVYTIFLVLTIALIAACQHKYNGPLPANADSSAIGNGGGNGVDTNGNNTADTGICFSRDILPIFISNCAKAGCHDAITRAEGYQLTDYNSIVSKKFVPGNASATEIYEKIMDDDPKDIMPPPPAAPLTAVQKSLIQRWINEGAKNTNNCGNNCDTNNFTFTADIKPIMDKYCKGCHSGSGAYAGIVLDNYTDVATSTKDGLLLGSIKHEFGFKAMPQGGNKLSDCEIRQVEKWIESGTLNN